MTLTKEAERAEDTAEAFQKFKDAVPEQASEIGFLISELHGIGALFREIDGAYHSDRYGRNFPEIVGDLGLVSRSLDHDLNHTFRILGNIGGRKLNLRNDDYRKTWKEILAFFYNNGRKSLVQRVEGYRKLCVELNHIMHKHVHHISCVTYL